MSGTEHVGFIVAAYAVTAVALGGTIAVLILDNLAQKRLLTRFAPRDGDDA